MVTGCGVEDVIDLRRTYTGTSLMCISHVRYARLIQAPQMVSLESLALANGTWTEVVQWARAYTRTGQASDWLAALVHTTFFADMFPPTYRPYDYTPVSTVMTKHLREKLREALYDTPLIQPYPLNEAYIKTSVAVWGYYGYQPYIFLLVAGVLQEGAAFDRGVNLLTGGHEYRKWLLTQVVTVQRHFSVLQSKILEWKRSREYTFAQAWAAIPVLKPSLHIWLIPSTDHLQRNNITGLSNPIVQDMYNMPSYYGIETRYRWLVPTISPLLGLPLTQLDFKELAGLVRTAPELYYLLRAYYRTGQLNLEAQLVVQLVDLANIPAHQDDPLRVLIRSIPIHNVPLSRGVQDLLAEYERSFSTADVQQVRVMEFAIINRALLGVLDVENDPSEVVSSMSPCSGAIMWSPTFHIELELTGTVRERYNQALVQLGSHQQDIHRLAVIGVLLSRYQDDSNQNDLKAIVDDLNPVPLWPPSATYLKLLKASFVDPLYPVEALISTSEYQCGIPTVYAAPLPTSPYMQAIPLIPVLGQMVASYQTPTYDQVLATILS